MKNKILITVLLIAGVSSIVFSVGPFNRWLALQSAIREDIPQSRQTQAIKYTGYEDIIHFAIRDSSMPGNIVFMPFQREYSYAYTEMFMLSAVSNHEVYMAPFTYMLKEEFLDKRGVSKIIVMHDNQFNILSPQSFWAEDAYLISSSYRNSRLEFKWYMKTDRPCRIHLFDENGFFIENHTVNSHSSGLWEYVLIIDNDTDNKPLYWAVSGIAFTDFAGGIKKIDY
ncbi:MAG: hypothetical protein R6U31_08215 [bacterium]